MTYIYRIDYMGGQCHSFPRDENDLIGWLEVLQGEEITEIYKLWAHGPRERVTDQYKWIIEGCNSRKPAGPPQIPTMLTIRAAADKTGLSYDFIRKLCAQEKITFVKAGAKFLVNFDKLVEYLDQGEKVGA